MAEQEEKPLPPQDTTLGTPVDFTDTVGVKWTVWEIAGPSFSERLASLLPHPDRRRGWLLFESEAGERRRLSPYPSEWRTFNTFTLERWCMRATRSVSSEKRRRDDDARA
jgi:hypothetical protein